VDLPLYLERRDFVYGEEQSKQTLTTILRNYYGSFIQAYYLGSQVAIHQPSAVIEEGIRATIKTSLPILEVQSVSVVGENVTIAIAGFGDLAIYNFTKNELNLEDDSEEY
jgi:hypothetical protein